MRAAQLSAHNWNQNYADSCCSTPQSNGLTAHGRDVIREMNRLGMMINVSHSSDETISQVIDVSDSPVIGTHHGLRSVNNIPRNMPDPLAEEAGGKRRHHRLSDWKRVQLSQRVRVAHGATRQSILRYLQHSGSG